MGTLRTRLDRLRTRVRMILVVRGVLISMAALASVVVGLALVDYVLRLPMGIRVLAFIGVWVLVWRCWIKLIRPTIQMKLSITDIALQIEQHDPALRGLVASAVDLEAQNHQQATDSNSMGLALSDAAISAVERRLGNRTLPGIITLGELTKAVGLFALIAMCIVLMSVRSPKLAGIGVGRVFSPWADISWPKRFAIVDATVTDPRPIDLAVPIRALIGSEFSADSTNARAIIAWRVLDESNRAINAWTSSMLVSQHRRDGAGVPIYEQLIDVQGVASGNDDSVFTLEYKITTRDDRTATNRIVLVRPPELVTTTIDVVLPHYADAIGDSDLVHSGAIKTAAYDTVVSPILASSHVTITWQFSKPIDIGTQTPDWLISFEQSNEVISFEQSAPNTLHLELVASASATIEPGVLDAMGIPVRKPIVLSLGVLSDLNPGVSIVEPARDEIVSTHAAVEIKAELSDDFGLSTGALYATRAQSPAESSGAPHEPIAERVTLIERNLDAQGRATIAQTLDLDTLGVEPGDQVWITATAWDIRRNETNNTLGMTESATRVLRVVSDAELIDQIRSGLSPIANALRQLDDQQAMLQQQLRDGNLSTSREQRSLTNRLEANARTIEQLQHDLQRNALEDAALQSLLNDAGSILDEASQAGDRASDQIDRGDVEKAGDNQRTVRDRIGELLSMLDRGQDSWLALRSVQQLRDELEAIRDDTAEFNAATAGQSIDQLSPDQQSALERIMERQIASAEDAREMLSTLDERAEQLEEHDPTQAEALRKAASQGRSAQIEQKLQEAGEQIGSNQTSSATQTQSEVLEELNEMLEELENTIKNRDNALRRELASIIESIEALIMAQEAEISAAEEPGADARMIALVGNTLTVRDDALGAFPETRSIADLITKAANAQNNAINALRQSPIAIDDAVRHERSSVLNLNSALEEANRLDEQAAQRQAQQLRAELRDAYREILETQAAVRDETLGLGFETLTRRQRADARALAASQESLREQLAEMLEQTQELADSPVFELAHRQLDRQMETSETGLSQRSIEHRVVRSQNASISILSTLVEVLSDTPPDQEQEDFEDGSSGGSGSGSGDGDEPVIPPIAQLKLLRSMQQLAAMQTREFSENPEFVNDADIEGLSELQEQLFEHGRKLIESLSKGPKPTEPGLETPIEPVEDSE